MTKKALVGLAVAAACLATSATASAELNVAGTGEPKFTRSDNNTQWVEWSAHNYDSYALRVTWKRDGQQVAQETFPVGKQGKTSFDWSGIVPLPLEQGRNYEICVMGVATLGGVPFDDSPDSCEDGAATLKRTSTTIDRSKPEISVELADGAASAPAGSAVPLAITYSDTQAQPFPANFLCFGTGPDKDTPCGEGDIYGYSAPCSVPSGAGLTATFGCEIDSTVVNPGGGPLWACITSADSSFPDSPTSADQSGAATAANLSEKVCDSVELVTAACSNARAKFARAKATLRRLKQEGASRQAISRAKARVRTARAAANTACA